MLQRMNKVLLNNDRACPDRPSAPSRSPVQPSSGPKQRAQQYALPIFDWQIAAWPIAIQIAGSQKAKATCSQSATFAAHAWHHETNGAGSRSSDVSGQMVKPGLDCQRMAPRRGRFGSGAWGWGAL